MRTGKIVEVCCSTKGEVRQPLLVSKPNLVFLQKEEVKVETGKDDPGKTEKMFRRIFYAPPIQYSDRNSQVLCRCHLHRLSHVLYEFERDFLR